MNKNKHNIPCRGLLVNTRTSTIIMKPEDGLEYDKVHVDLWLHDLDTKKMDGETAQHWLQRERLRQQLTIIGDIISGLMAL